MTIGIIGAGAIGSAIAKALARVNVHAILPTFVGVQAL